MFRHPHRPSSGTIRRLALLLFMAPTWGAISGCDRSEAAEQGDPRPAAGTLEHVEATRFQALHDELGGIYLDVRTAGEVASGHIAGASVVDSADPQLRRKLALMPRDRPIFVYCASGARSRAAAGLLHELGFGAVYDLKGGIMAWKRAGLPVERGALDAEGGSTGVTPAAFDAQIAGAPWVLASFETAWCGPCRRLAPTVDAVVASWQGKLTLARVDADRSEELITREKIDGVPVLVLYQAGKERWRHAGEIDREALQAALRRVEGEARPAAAP